MIVLIQGTRKRILQVLLPSITIPEDHLSCVVMKEQSIDHLENSQAAHVSVYKVEHETLRLHHLVSSYDSNMTYCLLQDSGADRNFSRSQELLFKRAT